MSADNPLLLVLLMLVGIGVYLGQTFGPMVQFYYMAGLTIIGVMAYFDIVHGIGPDDEEDDY